MNVIATGLLFLGVSVVAGVTFCNLVGAACGKLRDLIKRG